MFHATLFAFGSYGVKNGTKILTLAQLIFTSFSIKVLLLWNQKKYKNNKITSSPASSKQQTKQKYENIHSHIHKHTWTHICTQSHIHNQNFQHEEVMVPYLEEQILGGEVVHQADVVFIHHGQLATATAEVKAAHWGVLFQQQDWERVVWEDLHDLWRKTMH